MEALMQQFAKFEEPGAVSPALLKGLLTKLELPCPSDEELAAFVDAVEKERNESKAGSDDVEKAKDIGDCTFRAPEVASQELLKYVDLDHHGEKTKTMWDLFENSAKKFGDSQFFGTHQTVADDYEWATYSSVLKRVESVGSAFSAMSLERQSFVGIMLNTCPEWSIIEHALWRQALIPVTLYSTFGEEAMQYIINHSGLSVLVAGKEHISTLVKIAPNCAGLKRVIVVHAESEDLKDVSVEGVEFSLYQDEEAKGDKEPKDARPPTPDDLFLVIYTSGTTGNPKGATHKHSSMVATVAGTLKQLMFHPSDVHIAFLPMAHIMEQFLEAMCIATGAGIGFWSGDVRQLMADVAKLKPTMFVAVPRLLNRLFGTLQAGFGALEGAKKALYEAAMASKKRGLAQGRYKSYWDLIIFKKATMALGGRVRLIATGSAPIDPQLLEFFRIVFSAPVVEGYGMTEALITQIAGSNDTRTRSHVGAPAECVEMKLVSVPELNYLTTDNPPRGEICFRGPTIMQGYLKDEAKTADAIDKDGFYHSGDIGLVWPDGQLRIIDRIKHIFKLAQGEYVAPEKIEQTLVQSKYVAQIFVNGDSLKSCLVGVVVPDPDVAKAAAAKLGVTDPAALLTNEDFKKMVLEDLEKVGRGAGLKGFELVKALTLSGQEFGSVGLLTPTFKLKRNVARQHFADTCAKLYDSLN